jgi:hypothetical protein
VSTADAEWADQRRRAIATHAAELARREAAEAEQAAFLLAEFVEAARARDVEPVELRATSYDGRRRYRTGLRGWYLRPNLGVDTDGLFYVLSVRGSWSALVRGMTVEPARPRLVIGEGGRDGERITLRALLDRRLEQARG